MTPRLAAVTTSGIAILGTLVLSWVAFALWSVGDWLVTGGDEGDSLGSIVQEFSIGVVIWLMTYGVVLFWIPLTLIILLLDLCLFGKSVKEEDIRAFLVAEWGLIALPLSVLAVTNSFPVLIVPMVALLIAQLAREKPIRRMIAPKRVAGARPV